MTLETLTTAEARDLYARGNNAGEGFPPDGGASTIDDAIAAYVAEGWTVVFDRVSSDEVAVLTDDIDTIAIGGNDMGRHAWVVKISDYFTDRD